MALILEALRYHAMYPNNAVYSNIWLSFDYVPIRSVEILFDLHEPCFILLDELWKEADSRKAMSVINEIWSILLIRSRKLGWTIGYSEQFWRQIDIRIRYVTDVFIEPQMHCRGRILEEQLYSVRGQWIGERWYNGESLWSKFKSYDPPFNFEVENLRERWLAYRRTHR